MKFQLDFTFEAKKKISLKDKIMLSGSCFAEETGTRFQQHRFHALINPFGILFNPLSLFKSLHVVIEQKEFSDSDLVLHNGLYHSLQHHGSFSAASANETLKRINGNIATAHHFLKECNWLMLTFGSAWCWKYKDSGEIVANCHKIPAGKFEKVLLGTEQIVEEWNRLHTKLKQFNPALNCLFTVSPVRYVRDGLIENNLSKARLINAVHQLCEEGQHSYFPAYELVNDVLRDYRFFKEDMVHPNGQAVDFVWEKFCESSLDSSSKEVLEKIIRFNKFEQHRPLHPEEAHKHGTEVAEARLQLKTAFPFLNL